MAAKRLIDERITQVLATIPEADAVSVAEYISLGGKRLRGLITLETAKILGGSWEDALDAAAAVELVHSASLALDDIIDGDVHRRGKLAAWVAYGVRKTVMVSNLLIPLAQQLVYERYGEKALEKTVRAWLDISRGEVLDAFMDPQRVEPDVYLEIAKLKTGTLFRLAMELGAIAAGKDHLIATLSQYGEILGILYQIIDDMNDLKVKPNEPGIILFRHWIGDENGMEKAYAYIRRILTKIRSLETKVEEETEGKYRESLLREIPRLFLLIGGIPSEVSIALEAP
jgi:geranylgeranyl pyrophosphate synthase